MLKLLPLHDVTIWCDVSGNSDSGQGYRAGPRICKQAKCSEIPVFFDETQTYAEKTSEIDAHSGEFIDKYRIHVREYVNHWMSVVDYVLSADVRDCIIPTFQDNTAAETCIRKNRCSWEGFIAVAPAMLDFCQKRNISVEVRRVNTIINRDADRMSRVFSAIYIPLSGLVCQVQRLEHKDFNKLCRNFHVCILIFCPGNPFVWRAINLLYAPNDDAPPAFLKFASMMIFLSRGEGSWRSDRTAKYDFDLYCFGMLFVFLTFDTLFCSFC